MRFYPNGIGATLGDSLVTTGPLYMSGDVWYVDSESGADGSSPAGLNREAPLATLAQAVSNAANGDIIVLLSTHDEAISSTVIVNKSVTIVGEGSSGGNPTAKLTNDQGAASMILATAASVRLRNIWIMENAQACSAARITSSGAQFEMTDCYVECGGNDDAAAVLLNGARATFRGCTFISTAATVAAQPYGAVRDNATPLEDVTFVDCVFSDGAVGFSDHYALRFTNDATRLRGERVSLLLGADVDFTASSTGYFQVSSSSGGARVDW